MNEKISVVIPVEGLHPLYPCIRLSVGLSPSAKKEIGQCLEAVFSQSLKPHEAIVVDGHSTDRTVEPPKNIGRRVVFLGGCRGRVGCAHNSVTQTFKRRSFKIKSGV